VAVRRSGTSAIPGATLPDIAQLTAVAGRIAGDVANVAQRFQVAFDEQAARELRSSIRNFAELASTLAQTVQKQSGEFSSLSGTLKSGMASLQRASGAVEQVAVRLDTSTSGGQIHDIVSNVAAAAAELKGASSDFRTLSQELAKSQRGLQSIVAQGDSVMMKINRGQGSLGLLVNDGRLYHNGDSLVTQLRQLIADVQRNPKKYVNVRIF
jgi:phospholipid/cholesterol/gamma-HCH transport system substrate-binding protein